MKIHKFISITLCTIMLILTACSKTTDTDDDQTAVTATEESSEVNFEEYSAVKSTVTALTGEYTEEEINASWDEASATKIALDNNTIIIEGNGATNLDKVITINDGGTYLISGTLRDGQIIVDVSDENVQLVLNNVSLTSSTTSPLYIKNAKNVYLTLVEGTTNSFSDASQYEFEDTTTAEPSATIFSKSDLIINGNGSLKVSGNYNNGIQSKDDLKIVDGTIEVTSVDDGIIGKDSVTIRTGTITVNSTGDAIKATNTSDTSRGYIIIDGGNFTITSGTDAIQAVTSLIVNAGTFDITTNGGSANASVKENGDFNMNWGTKSSNKTKSTNSNNTNTSKERDTQSETTTDEGISAKAFKSGSVLVLNDGLYNLDSSDDSIHSNGTVTIAGGTFKISSGDDGIHADSSITIDEGTITISKSYEGIESEYITINDGTIDVVASDDGINVSGGSDSSSMNGRPGQNGFESSGNGKLTIYNGMITVNAKGDGLDANGSIEINGGTTYVTGPTNDGNGVVDYDQTFNMNGGTLLAAGSSGMAMTPSETSTQPSVAMVFDSTQTAKTLVHLEDSSGIEIATFAPSKEFTFVIISTPSITSGETYSLYTAGTYSTTSENNIYANGNYSGGTKVYEFAISSTVNTNTTISNNGFGGGFGGKGGKREDSSNQNGDMPTPAEGSPDFDNKDNKTPPNMPALGNTEQKSDDTATDGNTSS